MKIEVSHQQSTQHDWWRGAVIYQIYPRSFQDTTSNGTGDLNGIRQRLHHIAELGVDAIWISPFFKSPMKDFGYDVSDYRTIDPLFGSMNDFRALIDEAHGLGIKVIIDQVLSHTSAEHDWFKESRSSRSGKKADWYVWADAKPDGSPPNNWLSIFGGSAWQWDTKRCQYYFHNFLESQPDLNFHNRDVQDAILDTVRFWLDLGVDGFRLDTVNFYFHSESLLDNPPMPTEKRNANSAPAVNPYNFQSHLYDKSQPENLEFLKRFRHLLNEYPGTMAVGEVGDDEKSLELMAAYTAGPEHIHMCYSFDFLASEMPDAQGFAKVVENFFSTAADGWPCWAFSNHDVVRHASRWTQNLAEADREKRLKMLATLLMTLPGSVCLYQGEELGLREADIAYEDLQDPYGVRFWPEFKGRDGCRTPMVWEKGRPNAGFSDAAGTWLPIADEHMEQAVSVQKADHGSLLHHYQRILTLRKQHDSLRIGSFTNLTQCKDILVFERQSNDERLLCLYNLSSSEKTWEMPKAWQVHPVSGFSQNHPVHDDHIALPPNGCFIGRIEN